MRSSFRLAILLAVLPLSSPAHAGETRVTVMSYNVWKGWSQVEDGFLKGIASIKSSGADIAGLQEASPELAAKIASELGWFHAGKSTGSTQIVSRFPILESMAIDRLSGARIRLAGASGREILVFNCHLDFRFYGPYAALRPGATAESVLAEEERSDRAAQMRAMLEYMKIPLAEADARPVFLTGDFNGPSHLDWTAATAPAHGNIGPVAWSPGLQIASAGMIDSFRALHPDPLKEPGFTWSPIHKAGEPQDRIDFTYHKGSGVTVIGSRTFTTNVEATTDAWGAGEDLTPIRKNTWPSDHAAVVTEYGIK